MGQRYGPLEVKKQLLPSSDPGRFNLQIDGTTDPDATAIGDGGSTGEQTVTAGSHTVGETATVATDLTEYDTAIVCRDQGGGGQIVAQGSDAGPLTVNIADGAILVCTISNTFVPPLPQGRLEVRKVAQATDDPGRFNLQIDGTTDPDATGIGHGGSRRTRKESAWARTPLASQPRSAPA